MSSSFFEKDRNPKEGFLIRKTRAYFLALNGTLHASTEPRGRFLCAKKGNPSMINYGSLSLSNTSLLLLRPIEDHLSLCSQCLQVMENLTLLQELGT